MAVFALIALAGVAYGLWWRHAANILEESLFTIRAQGPSQGVTAEWEGLSFSGFPLRLRASLDKPVYANQSARFEWSGGRLHVELLPWSLQQFVLSAEGPQVIRIADVTIKGEAQTSQIGLKFSEPGAPGQFDAGATQAEAAIRLANGKTVSFKGGVAGFHWRLAPGQTADAHDHDLALNGRALTITGIDLPFGPNIDELLFQVTLNAVPAIDTDKGRFDYAAWSRSGAPVTIQRLNLVSGGVDISGVGKIYLFKNGAIEGEISLMVGGLDKIVWLLTERGAIAPEARTALNVTATMIAATGAKAPLPLVFKDGQTYLGPALIGPAPRIRF
jgi:hypothetical protein